LDYRELTGFLPDFVHDLTKIGIIGGEQCLWRSGLHDQYRLGGWPVGSKVLVIRSIYSPANTLIVK
jgi:hypothetical protein